MTVGTKVVIPYDTKMSPVAPREEDQSPSPLIGTVGVLTFYKNTVVSERYMLQVDLTAEVRIESDKYVVVDYQVEEYGIGSSIQEAQQDLLDSLVDYLVSLERRQHRLADRELRNLRLLRQMLKSR